MSLSINQSIVTVIQHFWMIIGEVKEVFIWGVGIFSDTLGHCELLYELVLKYLLLSDFFHPSKDKRNAEAMQ